MQRLLPHFLSPRKQQNICRRVMKACSCTEFYKSPSVLGVSSLCRQLLPQEVQRMKVESQEPTLQHLGKVRNPQPHSDQQVSGKWDKPDGHLENKDLENKLRRNFLQGTAETFFLASKLVSESMYPIWLLFLTPVPLPWLVRAIFFMGPCGESDQGTNSD